MGDIYEVIVKDKLFEKIKSGKCCNYIFLNDRKRLQYKIGNLLTFINNDNKITVTIENMFYFKTIKELLDMMGKEKFGYTPSQNSDIIEDSYYTSYKAEDIDKFGLVAIEFKLN